MDEERPAGGGGDDPIGDVETEGLGARSLKGGMLVLGAQVGRVLLRFGFLAILARRLDPDDFGLLAMVAAITSFLDVFTELGLSAATVQRPRLTLAQVSTLFWLNAGLGLALTLASLALAPAIAWFFHKPELLGVASWLSLGFLLNALGTQHRALLTRRMRFGRLSAAELGGIVAGGVAAVGLARGGFGVYALVAQALVGAGVTSGLNWLSSGWRPGAPTRSAGLTEMVRFGGFLTGVNALNYISTHFDNILIGRFLGAAPLALYDRAYQILLAPSNQINAPASRVVVPALSRLQDQPEAFREYFRRATALIVALGAPLVAFMFVAADEVILLLLGPKWVAAAPIFRVLAPAALLATFNSATGWPYVALGRTDRQFYWQVVASVVRVAAYVVGLRWGVMGVAVAVSVSVCALRLPGVIYCFAGTPLRLGDLGKALATPMAAALVAAVAAWAAGRLAPPAADPGRVLALGIMLAVFGLVYVLGWVALPGGRNELGRLIRSVRALRGNAGA